MKYKIKEFTGKYSINKKATENAARINLESKLKTLNNSLSSGCSDEVLKEYEDCKTRLESLYDNVTNGLIVRSRVTWYEKGEKSNKFFYNLEKRNKAKTYVKTLIIDNMITQVQEPIMKSLKEFYSSLYTRKSLKTEKEYLEYLAGISASTLSKQDQGLCERQLSLKEIFDALNDMPADKTPGNDGITKEFYLAFFDMLGPKLLMGYNHTFSQGELSTSQKQAVITLIEKKGRDKRYIKNWRPISLLNVDAKIISKILATRLTKVISQLISSDQTAYVPGRFIGESVRLTSDVLEYMKTSELPGYLITIDIEKAFDSVDHTFLVAVLKKFGFGDDFIRSVGSF